MWKAIVAGTAALAIAGTSLVYAQQRGGFDGGRSGFDGGPRAQFNSDDMRAFGEARLGHADIRDLYESPDYPLKKPA